MNERGSEGRKRGIRMSEMEDGGITEGVMKG